MEDDNKKLSDVVESLPKNGAGSEEAVAHVTAADAAADAPQPGTEQPPTGQNIPVVMCPFCQSLLFSEKRSGLIKYNIQMGDERIRIFACENCHCILPVQVMMLDTPMIAAPGPHGGRLIRQ